MDFFQGYQIDILCLYWAPFLKQRGPIELLNVFHDSGPVCDGAYRAARCTTTQRRRGAQVRSCMSGLTARCMLWLHLKRVDVPFAAFTSVLSSPTLATIRSRSDAVGKGTLLLQEAYYYSVAINTKLCGSLI